MGTPSETLAVYTLHALLWIVALWRTGWGPCSKVLMVNLVASWIIGAMLAGNERAVAMITLDYFSVIALCEMRGSARRNFVAFFSLVMIGIRAGHAIAPNANQYLYAVTINCVVTIQLLIAGGFMNDWGRRLDRWLDRVHPRIARAARSLATR